MARYHEAQEILFGKDLDLAARFNVKDESERGSILLDRVFEIYQASVRGVLWGLACVRACIACFVVLCGEWQWCIALCTHNIWKEGDKQTVPFFKSDGSRAIYRHPLNQRRVGNCLRAYVARIFNSGIVPGVRGEAWLVYEPDKKIYYALTFGTLQLASSFAASVFFSVTVSRCSVLLRVACLANPMYAFMCCC